MNPERDLKRQFFEESILFISILKWVAIATAVGGIVGCSTAGFLFLLGWSTDQVHAVPYYFLLLPLVFIASSSLVRFLAPEAEGHGTEKVIEAFHRRAGRIATPVVPVKLVATIFTLAFGGSAGKEGPCAQIGAGLASLLSDLLKFDDRDRKKLAICGISAGFASVFGTPISGAIFGLEVLFVGALLYDSLLPSFVAGVTGYHVARSLGVSYFSHQIDFLPVFSEAFFLKVLAAGLFFGICSLLLIETLRWGHKLSRTLRIRPFLKAALGGAALAGLASLLSPRYLGLGLETIESSLAGGAIPWYSFPAKILFTAITLTFGGSGGIVTPIFFIGASAGSLFGSLTGLDPGTFAAIGLVCLLAGATNAPLAASIMAVELFGPDIAPYAAGACIVSFLMTGHRSVFPSQVLSVRKSPSISVPLGADIDQVRPQFRPRKRGLVTLGAHFWRTYGHSRRQKKQPPPPSS